MILCLCLVCIPHSTSGSKAGDDRVSKVEGEVCPVKERVSNLIFGGAKGNGKVRRKVWHKCQGEGDRAECKGTVRCPGGIRCEILCVGNAYTQSRAGYNSRGDRGTVREQCLGRFEL